MRAARYPGCVFPSTPPTLKGLHRLLLPCFLASRAGVPLAARCFSASLLSSSAAATNISEVQAGAGGSFTLCSSRRLLHFPARQRWLFAQRFVLMSVDGNSFQARSSVLASRGTRSIRCGGRIPVACSPRENTGQDRFSVHRSALNQGHSFRTSVRLPASSPHGLAAHAITFDSWLPSEGPTRVFHPLAHLHAQRTRRRSLHSLRLACSALAAELTDLGARRNGTL